MHHTNISEQHIHEVEVNSKCVQGHVHKVKYSTAFKLIILTSTYGTPVGAGLLQFGGTLLRAGSFICKVQPKI